MRLVVAGDRRCPQCGERLCYFPGSERTVKGGTWYEVYCATCGYRADGFRPRRTKRKD